MKRKKLRRGLSLLLALCLALGCAGCGGVSAASMHLRKTEGTVDVSDAEGQSVALAENLGLYSGYGVGTQEESYAWIDLDAVKLAKMDQDSKIAVTKDGKNLSIEITGGSLFFNVTEPLAEDETMELRSSSMLVGIRGTCGWMSRRMISLLEGTVTVTAGEESVTITAGEQAVVTEDGALEVRELTFESIPAFVARELLDDEALQQTVREASGLGVPTTNAELADMLGDVVYSEEIDFEADGSPELLLVRDAEDKRLWINIYRVGPEGPEYLAWGNFVGISEPSRYSCYLTERDGRLYVCCRTAGTDLFGTGMFMDTYYGSVAERDGGREDWGWVDYFDIQGESRESGTLWISARNEKGFVDNDTVNDTQQIRDQEYRDVYTVVRELYARSAI